MIQKFDGDFPVSHLKFEMGAPKDPKAYAATSFPENYIIKIRINPNKLERPNVSIARTFIHEVIHAEMFRKMLSLANTNGAIDKTKLDRMWRKRDFPGMFDYYARFGKSITAFQHELMANHYRKVIADILYKFDNRKSYSFYYNILAWEGLHKTTTFLKLSRGKRDRIERMVIKFNKKDESCD